MWFNHILERVVGRVWGGGYEEGEGVGEDGEGVEGGALSQPSFLPLSTNI